MGDHYHDQREDLYEAQKAAREAIVPPGPGSAEIVVGPDLAVLCRDGWNVELLHHGKCVAVMTTYTANDLAHALIRATT